MNNFAIYRTPLGNLKISFENDAVTSLDITDHPEETGEKTKLTDLVYEQIVEYFDGKRTKFDFPYELKGTEFQMKVWKALCDIPYGETRSYKDIAIAINQPTASRAVGNANNKNPIMIAVPCHRVIGANGSLTGYAGGLHIKEALLTIEKK